MLRLGEIARLVGGELKGPSDLEITGAATVDEAGPSDITFAAEKRYFEAARSTQAACIIVSHDAPDLETPTIRVKSPRLAWAQVLEALMPDPQYPVGVHPTAVVAPDAKIGTGVSIQAHVVVGEGAVIGDGVVLGAGVVVGSSSVIGDGSSAPSQRDGDGPGHDRQERHHSPGDRHRQRRLRLCDGQRQAP